MQGASGFQITQPLKQLLQEVPRETLADKVAARLDPNPMNGKPPHHRHIMTEWFGGFSILLRKFLESVVID